MPKPQAQTATEPVPITYPPDILGPSLKRVSGVEHVIIRQKRRFASVDPHIIKGLLGEEDEDVCCHPRGSGPLPLPNSQADNLEPDNNFRTSRSEDLERKYTKKSSTNRKRAGSPPPLVNGLRVRPPAAGQLREIPDEYEYPVTALLVEMEDSFGRPLTIDIPDIPTPASVRIARSTSEPMTRNLRVNADVDKPLPPTPSFIPMTRLRAGQRSPVPSVASSGSVYSDYVEDGVYVDSEGQDGSEDSRLDLSEYVVVDLMPAEVSSRFLNL